MERVKSEELFGEAKKTFPGGVNSPVRAWKAVGGSPVVIRRARGSKITDMDGNEYVDYVGSWGPMIAGHAHPRVVEAVKTAAVKGLSYGAPCEDEILLGIAVKKAFPSMERLRFVSSGTEAVMSAVRVARAFTGRQLVVKFDGCYHGHSDGLLVKAGSGAATFGLADSAGVTPEAAAKTVSIPFNDSEVVNETFEKIGPEVACVIVEPVAGNMGVVFPEKDFLKGLRQQCTRSGALLVFDEVITGFRLCYGGAQKLVGVKPDLTCLGKIVGGGLPVGAYGGRREIMEMVAPQGDVYQAGTLSGNPVAMAAGFATLEILRGEGVYERLEAVASALVERIAEAANDAGVEVAINRAGSMFTVFFTESEVKDYESAKRSSTGMFAKYFSRMLAGGVYLPPSQFEACFVSIAHTWEDVERTARAAGQVFREIGAG